ncbi:MAG: thiamine pyrophosphate-binding protein, partial [Rhodobacteraceae bacterium]|nr:thiamine pyrophosphate-binding protein [Paracoccaceae bacterium]
MPDNPTYVHSALAQALIDHGVDTLFGLMGDANLFFADHFISKLNGKFVPVVYEGSAVLAAMAYWHAAGSAGVATVTHGPGLSNCVTALIEGARRQSPCVLICGDTPTVDRNALQGADQRELVKATGAGFEQVRAPDTALNDLAAAFHRAEAEKRPIVLNIPADFMWQEISYQKTVYPSFKTTNSAITGNVFDEALGMIAWAKRPIVLAGIGAIHAKDALISLSERLDAPLATTLKAKDFFAGHPNNMDIFGTLSTPDGYEAIDKADCIIAFGTSLHNFTTDRGKLFQGKRVVQVSDDLLTLGRFFVPDAGIVADPSVFAEQIVELLDEAEIAPSGFIQELEIASLSKHPDVSPPKKETGYLDLPYTLQMLDQALPKDRLLVTDGGRFMTEVWCRIAATDPQSFISGTDFGAIGLGMQTAIGMGVAEPERPVCLFTGDGGFMMGGLGEFNTAVRMGLDLIVVVCNDSAYG